MANEQQKLQQILDFSLGITQIQDIDILLEKILSAARNLVNADAGYIYIKEEGKLQCRHVQNETLQKQVAPGKKLAFPTFSIPISERSLSGYVAITGETLNIPDISLLPDDQPYSSDKYYRESSRYHTYSLLVVPLKRNREEIIGVMNLINARNDEGAVIPFAEDDVPFIRIFANHVSISIERAQTTRTRILGMIRVLTELHDPEETEAHVNRVGAYSAEIYETWARKKGMPQAQIETKAEILRMAAMLHDLGKLAIPYNIWKKPERLTTEEYDIIKQHTVKGAQMLLKSAQTEYEEVAVEIALNHHEYWNGEGYPGHVDPLSGEVISGYEDAQGKPRGKKGEEIPVFGRVVAIADVYDSLLCRRIYRTALKEPQVLKILKKESGKHFDPEMIDAFFSSLDAIHAIARKFPNESH